MNTRGHISETRIRIHDYSNTGKIVTETARLAGKALGWEELRSTFGRSFGEAIRLPSDKNRMCNSLLRAFPTGA
ncbi:hypothetical protein FUAX_47620 (plasmid) [Fulvitalea axinellae]|uniref:Uncharacterized protein n=1 Tax=Fulvitalea axinellae TaxID=1182444 RepID=A0AAU9DID4_9BACT|nr:hypothetical protein FUAX_47620 [Fulvitalea axinellae]